MLSFSMRMLWLNVSYAVVFISSSSRVLDSVNNPKSILPEHNTHGVLALGLERPPVS